jgi:hypothetical protein
MREIVYACDLEGAAPLRGHADGTFLPFHQGFTEIPRHQSGLGKI